MYDSGNFEHFKYLTNNSSWKVYGAAADTQPLLLGTWNGPETSKRILDIFCRLRKVLLNDPETEFSFAQLIWKLKSIQIPSCEYF